MFSRKSEAPTTRLRELSGSDFTIAKSDTDIRGWDVRDNSGRKFGTVQDLIFDIRAGKVRYMVLNILDTPEMDLEKRTVLVPIGLAELDPSDNDVLLPQVNPFQLRALPRYDRSALGAKAERDISTVFGRQGQQPGSQVQEDVDEQFYNHEHFDQNNMYRRRRNDLGGNRPLHRSEDQYHDAEMDSHRAMPVRDERLRDDPYNDPDYRHETDEEYFRRTGRHRPRM